MSPLNAVGAPGSVLVLGGTSDIGLAYARRALADGAGRIVLAGRDPAAMRRLAEDLGGADVVEFDLTATAKHEPALDEAWAGGDVDIVVLAAGVLPDQELAANDPGVAVAAAEVNYVGAMSMALRCAARLRAQGHGVLVVLSSVAAERARRSNFVYGSTKAGLDALAQGLGDSLHGSGVRVLVVRPGFVRTKMTADRKEAPFAASADEVADAIARGIRSGAHTIWVPSVLRWVMVVVRHLPRAIFRRIPL
ncbi:MAG TPA: decaprenylphospho-beta-D-erythro-pentofuranosid-2-ulose 2-reductase [Actinomycetota bacterium]